MFELVTFKDVVKIPPRLFGEKISKAARMALREEYEGKISKSYGVILSIQKVKVESKGKIFLGDGSVYCDAEFEALTFNPVVNEIVDGRVTEILSFGAFTRLGPVDALVHVSQIANDFMSFDKKTGMLVAKNSKKTLRKGELIRARIATISWKDTVINSKIALTMRPMGMGGKKGE